MTVNIDLLEVNLAGCNTKGVTYTGTDDLLLNTFSTAGARQCWMYCRYAIKCLAMSFQVMDGTCSLLAEYREDESMYGAEDVHVAVSKNCMESDNKNSAGANLTEIVSLSSSGTGFLIQQVSSALVCLAAGKRMLRAEDKEMYRVTWKSCAESTTTRWIMRPVGHLESEDKASSELYQISPADQLDLCLDVHISEKGQGAMEAVLKKCREVSKSSTGSHNAQMMLVKIEHSGSFPNTNSHDAYSIFSTAGVEPDDDSITILFTSDEVDNSKSLHGVSFRKPAFYEEPPRCTLSQFSTPHGSVRNKENLPFFLPGHQVDVECDRGFGVRLLNYTTLQTVVCSQAAKPLPCTRIVPKKGCRSKGNKENKRKGALRYPFLIVAIVSLAIVGALLMILMKTKRKKIGNADIGLQETRATIGVPNMERGGFIVNDLQTRGVTY